VAAVILAPVLGNIVVTTYPSAFWGSLHDLREKTGVLVIFDDVQAGMGRAGALATWTILPGPPVKPDIMALGKGIAMGYPMSAMLATNEVAKAFTPGVHFNTFGGSPFVCHMSIKMMEWLDAHQHEVNEKGDWIRDQFRRRPWVDHVDGSGMLNAFTPDFKGFNGYEFCKAARERGVSLMTHRPLGPIRFTPPLNVSYDELAEVLSILDSVHFKL
jgi:acetylornithine/N-succinyldiaminopimelate aminotransferase